MKTPSAICKFSQEETSQLFLYKEENNLTVPSLQGSLHTVPHPQEGTTLAVPYPSLGSSLTPSQRVTPPTPLSVSPSAPLCVLPLPAVFQSVQPYLGPAWTSGHWSRDTHPWLYWTHYQYIS